MISKEEFIMHIAKIMALYSILCICIMFSGCSDSRLFQVPDNSDLNISTIGDPIGDKNNSNTSPIASFAYGLSFGADDVRNNNGNLWISPSVTGDNRASAEIGLLVFVDGIPQKYSVGNADNFAYMTRFNTKVKTKETYDLLIDASLDQNLSEHTISIASISYPDYYPDKTPVFGMYHKILAPLVVDFGACSGIASHNVIKSLTLDNKIMTQEDKDKYGVIDDGVMDISLNQNNNSPNYTIENGELKLTLNAYSTSNTSVEYRVSIYKNHEHILFNGDYEYVDVKLEGGKFSVTDITLNDVASGDFVYCIAVPLNQGEVIIKSKSMIALNKGEKFPSAIRNDSSNGSDNNYIQSTDDITNSSTPPDNNNNSQTGTNEFTVKQAMPLFSIGDTLYYTSYDGMLNIYASKNGTDIDNSVSVEYNMGRLSTHDEYVSLCTDVNGKYWAFLFDKDLNLVKSTDLTHVLPKKIWGGNIANKIDFDDSKIVYTYWDENITEYEIRCCDWDLKNIKSLCKITDNGISSISLARDYVAFWLAGYSDAHKTDSYGIVDFVGNLSFFRKDGVSSPQVSGEVTLWSDQHVDVDKLPSGSVVIFKNGKFSSFRTVEQSESQFAFLCGNSILTLNGSGNTLRVYNINGSKTAEIAIEDGYSGAKAIMIGNKIYVDAYGKSTTTLIYEVN